MIVHNIFPTPIMCTSTDKIDLCHKISEELINQICYDDDIHFYSTNDDLHKDTTFAEIVEIVEDAAHQYFDYMGVDKTNMVLCNMWMNLHTAGGNHSTHLHPNSYFSGVLYLNIPEDNPEDSGMFVVEDPRPNAYFHRVDYSKQTEYSHTALNFIPKTGDIYMFPSWLEHGTTAYKHPRHRVILSFNYMPTMISKRTAGYDFRGL